MRGVGACMRGSCEAQLGLLLECFWGIPRISVFIFYSQKGVCMIAVCLWLCFAVGEVSSFVYKGFSRRVCRNCREASDVADVVGGAMFNSTWSVIGVFAKKVLLCIWSRYFLNVDDQ